jgi:hypothetical protein
MLESENTKDIYLVNKKMSKVDFCTKKAKGKANFGASEALNLIKQHVVAGELFYL